MRVSCDSMNPSWHAVPCCAVLCCAVLCCAVLCCVLCSAVLCCAVLCCAVLVWRPFRENVMCAWPPGGKRPVDTGSVRVAWRERSER
jgi:hypothetical protein